MFFLFTNIIIGKYYPNITTQFIFGAVCYVLLFFLMQNLVKPDFFKKYKYYLGIILALDLSFLAYQYKYNSVEQTSKKDDNVMVYEISDDNKIIKNVEKNFSKLKESFSGIKSNKNLSSEFDISFSSDIIDYKVSHNQSLEKPKRSLPVKNITSSDKSPIKGIKPNYDNNLIKSETDITFSLS